MPIRINDLSIIDSANQVVPRAAGQAEVYLQTLARYIQEIEPPVTMDLDTVEASRGLGGGRRLCLVVTPTKPRLKRYPTAHYANPVGAGLDIGYWLLGGDKAAGIGFLGIGAATDMDVAEVRSIVQMIEDYAVAPALNEIVTSLGSPQQQRRGFLGA